MEVSVQAYSPLTMNCTTAPLCKVLSRSMSGLRKHEKLLKMENPKRRGECDIIHNSNLDIVKAQTAGVIQEYCAIGHIEFKCLSISYSLGFQ